jgi:hypothetical protein
MGMLFTIWVCIMLLTGYRYSKYELRIESLGFDYITEVALWRGIAAIAVLQSEADDLTIWFAEGSESTSGSPSESFTTRNVHSYQGSFYIHI